MNTKLVLFTILFIIGIYVVQGIYMTQDIEKIDEKENRLQLDNSTEESLLSGSFTTLKNALLNFWSFITLDYFGFPIYIRVFLNTFIVLLVALTIREIVSSTFGILWGR